MVPARKEPAGASEMVTQLLFGEYYQVLESRDGWLKIRTLFDNYECWINEKQHQRLSDASFKALQKDEPVISTELVHIITDVNKGIGFPLSIGAILPFFKNREMRFDDQHFSFDGHTSPVKQKGKAKDVLSTAYLLLNAPYLWGGKSPLGIDCSGFTQVVYRSNGYLLPRDSQQQVELGSPRSFVEEAEPGDLAFFDNEEGRIVHVGIIIDNERIIHSSGSVRIDRYDHYGIFHSDNKKYSHHLRVIKQLI